MEFSWESARLHPLDLTIIALYVGGLLYLGLRSRLSPAARLDHYLLGGRRLTLVPFVATLVSTWYGGILGVGEFTYLNGVVNLLVFGLPYYIFAILYALFFAARIRRGDALTIPERFRQNFGPRSARFSAVLVFLLTTPAPYLLMLGVMLNFLLGLDLWVTILLGTIFSTIYLWRGGFQAVVRTDLLQFILMFVGFAVLLSLLLGEESLVHMWRELPAGHRDWRGAEHLSWQVILVWFLIASWTFVDPGFYQRCAAARTGRTAARGIIISVGFWLVFDLLTTATGLYAVIRLSDLTGSSAGPVAAYPLLGAAVLPVGLRGFFFAALLAVIMSTVDSFVFISATTLGRDFALPDDALASRRTAVERRRIRWGIVASAVVGYFLAVSLPSVVELWYTLGMVLVPGLLLPILFTFYPRITLSDKRALTIGLVGVITAGIWLITPDVGRWLGGGSETYPLGLQPMLPGLLATIILVPLLGKKSSRSLG
ncbi:MAG: sodium:solute symporter family protein [Fidelibacterota bacterium]|nr:MAG: sodium:solute symporter family protein [Candidatus Neomarinimicrobiota bacterium]